MRVRSPSKLAPKWKGLWLVMKSLGPHGSALKVLKSDGSVTMVAIANIKLWRGFIQSQKWGKAHPSRPSKCGPGAAVWSSDSESNDLGMDSDTDED